MKLPLDQIYCMDCIEGMKQLKKNSIDAIVTDPPYGLEFMGKEWDKISQHNSPKANAKYPKNRNMQGLRYSESYGFGMQEWHYNWAIEILRVLKPGGHLLSFGGTRTYHRMVCAIEDAGFEIRDQIMWVYGSGFPKSLNIGKAIDELQGNKREVLSEQKRKGRSSGILGKKTDIVHINDRGTSEWEGLGTALKPAHEPIVLARKPLSENTIAENVLRWGTGGLNIDGCRIGYLKGDDALEKGLDRAKQPRADIRGGNFHTGAWPKKKHIVESGMTSKGRFPANFIHDGSDEVEAMFAKMGERKSGSAVSGNEPSKTGDANCYGEYQRVPFIPHTDSGSASRFFYCAKTSKSEREHGLSIEPTDDKRITPMAGRGQGGLKCKICNKWKNSGNPCTCDNPDFEEEKFNSKANLNIHPTVKPLALMEYLVKLITREEQLVLDPFIGSGTTAIACRMLNRHYIGFEVNPEYCTIAKKRLNSIPERLESFF